MHTPQLSAILLQTWLVSPAAANLASPSCQEVEAKRLDAMLATSVAGLLAWPLIAAQPGCHAVAYATHAALAVAQLWVTELHAAEASAAWRPAADAQCEGVPLLACVP